MKLPRNENAKQDRNNNFFIPVEDIKKEIFNTISISTLFVFAL